jgi:hypothetical protein
MRKSDFAVLLVLIWLTLGTGLLFYFPPLSLTAKRIRVFVCVAVFVFVLNLSLHTAIVDTKTGALFEVGLHWGPSMFIPWPYGYFVYQLLRISGLTSLVAAVFGPIAYLFSRAIIR